MDKGIFRGARELAAYTGFSENAIHLMVSRGALPVHRHGRRLVFVKAEIDSFYEQHKAQFGTQTKEQLAPQIAAMLKNQKLADAQRDYMKGLRKKYGAKTLLEPPRIEIAVDDDAAKGPAIPLRLVRCSQVQPALCPRQQPRS